ncbi:MAG: ABC transporter transmembrane domain-containing protein, partial [Wenzhouxiangella sp.]
MSRHRLLKTALMRQRSWILAGIVLSMMAMAAAVVLLALSGWLITAGALAGLGLLVGLDIFTPGAGIRLSALVRTVGRYGERLATHQATFRALADLRVSLFERLLELDEFQLRRFRHAETGNRLTADVENLDHLIAGVIGPVAAALILTLAVAGLAVAVTAQPAAAAPALILLAAGSAVFLAVGRAGYDHGTRLGRIEPELRNRVTEGLEAMETLRAFDRTRWQAGRIEHSSSNIIALQERLARLDAAGQGLINLVANVALWIMLCIGLWLHDAGQATGPALAALALVMLGLTEAWQPLPAAWRRLARCRISTDRIDELDHARPMLPRPSSPRPLPADKRIRLAGVSFRYPGAVRPVFDGFDLQIEDGQRVAVTGASGCGKTTLA